MQDTATDANDGDVLRNRLGLLSEEQLAAILNLEVVTVRTWRSRRTGPPFLKAGSPPLYALDDVMSWLRSKRCDTLDSAA